MSEIDNLLLKNFLLVKDNADLFHAYKNNPNHNIKEELENNFKKYYFKIRAISYLNKVIHFESKKFDSKIREYTNHYQVIMDKPISPYDTTTLSDLLIDEETTNSYDDIPFETLEDYIENQHLHSSIKNLSKGQKEILYLAFVINLNDTEIATILNISQQAVTKTKNKALIKIRRDLNDT